MNNYNEPPIESIKRAVLTGRTLRNTFGGNIGGGEDIFQIALDAIAVMEGVIEKTDETSNASCDVPPTPSANLVSSEIRLIKEIERSMLSENCPEKYVAGLSLSVQIVRNYFATREPLPVSLAKCAGAAFEISDCIACDFNDGTGILLNAHEVAKAVLDAAGIIYVD